MARVFISYRRADGQYAVGWIEERLRRLDEVTHLRTAFRDNSLRLGDDLSDRLADEVRQCDVLIAVIGPHWRGVRDDGSARIDDEIDWVGREIVSALGDGKRIIPVLIGGAEPLQSVDLPESLRPFADLLAVRFEGVDDLELLERDLREYLDELDHQRARLRGLDQPIVAPSVRQPAWVWALALVVGAAAGVIGSRSLRQPDLATEAWAVLTSIEIGVWAGLCVLGVSYVRRVLGGVVVVRWPTVAKTAALALALLSLTVVAFGPGDNWDVAFTVLQGVLAIVLISPWIVVMLGASWSRTASAAIRDRAEVIAIHRRGLRIATPILAIVLALAVVATAALLFADGTVATGELDHFGLALEEALSLLAFGVFLTLILMAALQFSLSALQHDSDRIRDEISDLAPAYRRHVDDVLVDRALDIRLGLVWIATLPCATGIAAALVGWRWT
jgi:hypothetical protein